MPRGSPLTLEGLLLEDGRQPVLRVDDGGMWRVEMARSARRLLGQRVQVIGTRDGFDLIAATRVTPAEPRNPVS